MKKIVKIMPHYEPRMWGGGIRLKEEFHYDTDVAPLGKSIMWWHCRDMRIVKCRK